MNKLILNFKSKDSKKINFENRLKIAEYIKKNSYYAVGVASVEEIFNINIHLESVFFKANYSMIFS